MSIRTQSKVDTLGVISDHHVLDDIERDLTHNLRVEAELLLQAETNFKKSMEEVKNVRREREQLLKQAKPILNHGFSDWYDRIYEKQPKLLCRVHRVVRERVSPQQDIDNVFGYAVRKKEPLSNVTGHGKPASGKQTEEPIISANQTKAKSKVKSKVSDTPTATTDILRNNTCRVFEIPEIPIPDNCNEAIAYLKSTFTSKIQWSYLHAYINSYEL